jgi:hypothetical protein
MGNQERGKLTKFRIPEMVLGALFSAPLWIVICSLIDGSSSSQAASNSLMPAVIAAASGLFGTALAIRGTLSVQTRMESQRQEYDRQKEIRRQKIEKLEELASALYSHGGWLIQLHNFIDHDDTLPAVLAKAPPASFTQIDTIALIHFPTMRDNVYELSRLSASFVNTSINSKLYFDQSSELLGPYFDAPQRLENRIRDYISHLVDGN